MSVGQLADAFSLDVSTLHRQVAAAMKAGLVERITDPAGGAARLHRATEQGRRRLAAELAGRRESIGRVVADWPAQDVSELLRLLRRFNQSSESIRERPWPRR
ncbi:MarR family winged helix-turn-helix transcriptional regulator [Luteococcus sp. OSA5]|uniref:MarR family winged helix-turn-helix transcriptional regulator n=1 Tax=Luteococcus sp. OSA5 TaxID=3401630 RepID=UPI003B42E66B